MKVKELTVRDESRQHRQQVPRCNLESSWAFAVNDCGWKACRTHWKRILQSQWISLNEQLIQEVEIANLGKVRRTILTVSLVYLAKPR